MVHEIYMRDLKRRLRIKPLKEVIRAQTRPRSPVSGRSSVVKAMT